MNDKTQAPSITPTGAASASTDVLGAFMQPRTLIDLTDEQLDQLAPLFLKLKSGGAIWGQIFGDGMHVKVISPEDVTKVQAALGRQENRTWSTAAEAYEAGLQEDATNVVGKGRAACGASRGGRRPERT